MEQHGQASRKNIVENYKWNDKGEHLYNIIIKETNHLVEDVKKQTVNTNEGDDNDDEDIIMVEGGDKEEANKKVDDMSVEEMKAMLKKMLKN